MTAAVRPGGGHAARRDVAVVVGAALATLAVFSTWPDLLGAVWMRPGPDAVADVSLAVEVVAAFGAGTVAVVLSRRFTDGRRRTWLLLGLAAAAWGAGSLVWLVHTLAGNEPPYPGPQDLGYLLMPVLVLVAVLAHPAERPAPRAAVTVVDALLTATALAVILWVGVLRWSTGDSGPPLVTSLVNLAYPLTDLVLIVLVTELVRRVRPTRRPALELVALGLAAMALADTVLLVRDAFGAWDGETLLTDAPWTVGWVLIGGAAVVAARGAARDDRLPGRVGPALADDEVEQLSSRPLPLVLAVIALVVSLAVIALRPDDVGWVIPMAIVVVILLLSRQALTLRENRLLASRLSRSVADLAHAADHDALTGLHNRVGLEERIRAAGDAWRREASVSAVAFVDIDHLKAVNDSLGHAAGDRLITATAERLRDAGLGDVTRFGGDEFVVVMDGLNLQTLGAAVGTLVEVGSRPVWAADVELQPSISVGVAIATPGVEPRELLRRSDVALYRAKQSGRRRAAVYEPAMDADTRRHLQLEPELRAAVERDEFVLHYQPVVDAASGRFCGAEALLRWQHPERGLLTPDQFLDDADALGLLDRIGHRTLQRATADFATLGDSDLRVAVNLSASELAGGRAAVRVRTSLAEAGLDPSRLVLEIREDVVVDDTTRRTIDELAAGGVEIAIDDFGTGNSSLRQLGTYPASVLKIDRSFVDGLGTEPEDTFVVRAVLNLAHNLGLRTVAEGVETETQLRLLVELGCDQAQGWLFGRPVPFGDFVERYVRPPASDVARPSGGTAPAGLRSRTGR